MLDAVKSGMDCVENWISEVGTKIVRLHLKGWRDESDRSWDNSRYGGHSMKT